MPYPVGMQTRYVSFAPFYTPGGVAVQGFIRITAARAFIWDATDEVFLTDPVEVETNGVSVQVELPVADQAGFVDGAGNTISGWSYTAHYSLSAGMYVEPVTFLLPAGAALPIVPDISTQITGGVVNVPYPVQGEPGPPGLDGAGATDATTLAKGIVQLTGDLGGTAALPTVPGLAGKAPTVHTHAQADVTNLVTDLAGKAPTVHTHAQADVTNLVTDLGLKAPLASPALTGTPTAPTAATATNTTQVATTAFVKAQAYATLASPALTGNPTAPTPAVNDNDTSIATTAFVTAADTALGATKAALVHTHAQADVTNLVTDLAAKAPLASPALTGVPTAPTAAAATNTTQLATTAFVVAEVAAGGGGGGGATPLPATMPKASGHWLQAVTGADFAAGGTAAAGPTVTMSPILVTKQFDCDALGVQVTTLEAVGTRLLLYSADSDGFPVTLVATATATPAGTGNLIMALGAPVTLPPGLYWAAVRTDAGSTARFRSMSLTSAAQSMIATAQSTFSSNRAFLVEGDVGTFAAPTTPLTTVGYRNDGTNIFPMIGLRRA